MLFGRRSNATGVPGRQGGAAMTPERVMERIMEINPTATSGFLAQFGPESLRNYLDHLVATQQPRDGRTGWRRPVETRAIMVSSRRG